MKLGKKVRKWTRKWRDVILLFAMVGMLASNVIIYINHRSIVPGIALYSTAALLSVVSSILIIARLK